MCYVKILIWAIEIQVPKTKHFQNHKEAIKSKMSGIVVTVNSFFWSPKDIRGQSVVNFYGLKGQELKAKLWKNTILKPYKRCALIWFNVLGI